MKKPNLILSIAISLIALNAIFLIILNKVSFNEINEQIEAKELRFEAYQKGSYKPIITKQETDRYREKLWEYYDKREEARDRTIGGG